MGTVKENCKNQSLFLTTLLLAEYSFLKRKQANILTGMHRIPQIHVACLPPQNNSSITEFFWFLWQRIISLHVTGQILPSEVWILRPNQCFASFLHLFRKTKFPQIVSSQRRGLDDSLPSAALRIKQWARFIKAFGNTLKHVYNCRLKCSAM